MGNEKFFITPDTMCGDCPECNVSWDGGDVFEKLRADEFYKDKTDEEVMISASQYGWSEQNKRRLTRLMGIELPWDHPDHKEGISFYQCPDCNAVWNRFTGDKVIGFESYASKKIDKKV